jgi:predicted PurR-regulated permease PerM
LIRSPFKVRQLERFMPRALAIVIAYVLVFTVLGIAISNLAPILTNQARTLEKSLPGYAASMQQTLNQISARFSRLRLPENLQQDVSTRISNYLGETATNFGSILTSLPWLLLVPILAFFFLKDVNLYRVSILRLVPSGKWRTRVEKVLFDVNKTLAAYTRAQIISCVFIGLVCTVGFTVIGLDYAILLGILAGVFEFVPLIGPLSIAILATTLAFLESPWQAVYTASFLIILRLVHDYITYPRIIREGIHLHPLAVILSVLAGEQVAGIPGVFISIPVVALLTVLYKHVMMRPAETPGRVYFFVSISDCGISLSGWGISCTTKPFFSVMALKALSAGASSTREERMRVTRFGKMAGAMPAIESASLTMSPPPSQCRRRTLSSVRFKSRSSVRATR